jgi:hypothetical protein
MFRGSHFSRRNGTKHVVTTFAQQNLGCRLPIGVRVADPRKALSGPDLLDHRYSARVARREGPTICRPPPVSGDGPPSRHTRRSHPRASAPRLKVGSAGCLNQGQSADRCPLGQAPIGDRGGASWALFSMQGMPLAFPRGCKPAARAARAYLRKLPRPRPSPSFRKKFERELRESGILSGIRAPS